MISLILRFREVIAHRVRGRAMEGGEERATGLIRISLSQSDDLHCWVKNPGELTGVKHFSTFERCWNIEGWCGESYWVTMKGRAGVHVCLMVWGICKAIGRPAALVFLPSVPGLYHRRVTPALSHLTLRWRLRNDVDPNLSLHTQHYNWHWERDAELYCLKVGN